MKNIFSVKFTRWSARVLGAVVIVLCFCLRDLLSWWHSWRNLPWQMAAGLLAGFYLSVCPVLFALASIDKLLSRLLDRQVFTWENVALLRRIFLCCAVTGAVCLLTALCYPGMLVLAGILAFLSLVVSVVAQVLGAAVELREENDLTV